MCKDICKGKAWCRSVEYHTSTGGSCTISSAHSSSAQLHQPCFKPGFTYTEITGNNGDVRRGGQGGAATSGFGSCNDDSHCKANERCASNKCVETVDPCKTVKCGDGAICQVKQRQPVCSCPVGSQGNPLVLCQSTQGCRDHSQCANNKICENGKCVDPCELIKCGHGAICQTSGRHPMCICPSNTQGDPLVNCQPKSECAGDANCGANKVCRSGSCVNPCDWAKCGEGATCQVFHRRPLCMCPDNTQVQEQVQCRPTHGPSVCQFPFIYKGTTFTACTTESDPEGKPWCSTKTDSQKNHQKGNWQHCTDFATCKFPFIHKNVRYSECTTVDAPDGKPWCSTKTDSRSNHQKGNFKHCTNSGTSSDFSTCKFPFIYKNVRYSDCTTVDASDGKPWCSTKTDSRSYHQEGNFKHCTNSGTSSDFATCKFPFIYKNVRYSDCTTVDASDGKPWCSTKTDSRSYHQEGNFKHCTNSGTSSDFATCKFPFIYKNVRYSDCTTVDASDGKPWCSTKTDSRSYHQEGNFKHCTNSGTSSDNELKQNPTNIEDRNVMVTPATNNLAVLQFTQTPIKSQGQESTRDAGCYSLPDPGECRGAFPRFYYNQQTDQCDCFLFGGCDEERIQFTWLSLEECLRTCVPTNKAKGPGCERVTLEEVHRFLENQ